MNFHYNYTNWLPFYWSGYQQTTRYTYVIENLADLELVFSNFDHSKRKNINRAEKIVNIYDNLKPEEFYDNHKFTLNKQGKNISYTFELFRNIHTNVKKQDAGKIWCAKDNEENIHAAIFVVYDSKSAYYLISTIDPDYRNSGAASLLLKHAITYVSQFTKKFDFEGSMIQGVENSFRKFGAVQNQYFRITKDNRLVMRSARNIYKMINRAFAIAMRH
jgi:lipid II:glycine glycyltransferase (peptidoglycan interpeptide bridge formation enzyme)